MLCRCHFFSVCFLPLRFLSYTNTGCMHFRVGFLPFRIRLLLDSSLLREINFFRHTFHSRLQERALVKEGKHGSADAERTFFMPTDADAPVRACRKWYNSRGGGGPPWARVSQIVVQNRVASPLHRITSFCTSSHHTA